MRVLISGGGTGGHVYPALAVVQQIQKEEVLLPIECEVRQPVEVSQLQTAGRDNLKPEVVASHGQVPRAEAAPAVSAERKQALSARESLPETQRHELLWIGAVGGIERKLVSRAGLPFQAIETGQLRGINPLVAAGNALRMVRGLVQAHRAVAQFQPHVCFVTGGYVCVPVALACRILRVPIVVYLPDVSPGMAIRSVSYLAQRVAVTFEEVAHYFGGLFPKGKAVVTGYPVRKELVKAAMDRQNARSQLTRQLRQLTENQNRGQSPGLGCGFSANSLPLLLIWGGSLGSRSINQATWNGIEDLLKVANVLHLVGNRDWPLFIEEYREPIANLPENLSRRYYPAAFLHEEMIWALAAADLTVSRAGASTLGEFPVARLPSILVPLPYQGVGQVQNAQLLAEHGGAIIIEDRDLGRDLIPTAVNLLANAAKRRDMENMLIAIAKPEAALNIVDQLFEVASSNSRRRLPIRRAQSPESEN